MKKQITLLKPITLKQKLVEYEEEGWYPKNPVPKSRMNDNWNKYIFFLGYLSTNMIIKDKHIIVMIEL